MTAFIIDGKARAAGWRLALKDEVAARLARGAPRPGLRVVIVGDHPPSRAYVRIKARVADELGIDGGIVELPTTITTDELLAVVEGLNADPAVHAMLVQLPLPPQVDVPRVLEAIDPAKDVDGFHPVNVGRLTNATRPDPAALLIPCTPLGCLDLLLAVHGEDGLAGKRAVVLGRSNIVGKPLATLLLSRDCTVAIAHSRTADPERLTVEADLLIAAIGRPELVRGSWIKPGATVIDVGVSRVADGTERGRLVGDVAFEEARAVAGTITPVPGGVGPMTVAMLMRNTLAAHALQTGILA